MSDEHLNDQEEHPHLLLVDDDATFTRVMARAMERRGLRVSVQGTPCVLASAASFQGRASALNSF